VEHSNSLPLDIGFIMCQFRFQYHASLVLRTLGGTLIQI
jgi:hypothetical protein